MTATTQDYSEPEWQESAGHHPLAALALADLLLVHRHWMWANQQRENLDRELRANAGRPLEPGVGALATKRLGFMFVWYGLLWAVVEALTAREEGRNIDVRGRFREDLTLLGPLLRRCRNAVMHVPRNGELLDDRIADLVAEPGAAHAIRRISMGFGRLFLEEFSRRRESVDTSVG